MPLMSTGNKFQETANIDQAEASWDDNRRRTASNIASESTSAGSTGTDRDPLPQWTLKAYHHECANLMVV